MAGQVAATLFTRGQPGEADNRGESMVRQADKLQSRGSDRYQHEQYE